MKSFFTTKLGTIATTLVLGMSLLPAAVSAQEKDDINLDGVEEGESAGRKGKKFKKMKLVKKTMRDHMRLADYYMLRGQYGSALRHFEKLINFEVPDKPKAELFAKAGKKKRGKRGKRGKKGAVRGKMRALMGAAVAAHKLGNTGAAKDYAQTGLDLADKHNIKRASKKFEKFLADPAKSAKRFAPSAKELEAKLKKADSKLDL